jgi:hypothetical protein
MHSDDATPAAADDDEAARLIQEGLDPIALPPDRREALLRHILERTGGLPPLAPASASTPAPAPPPKAD